LTHPSKPNLVFVFADQFRAESLPANDPDVQAPNLQRMADEGMTLTHTYSSNPVCSPARASIISGMYSHTHGLVNNNLRLRTDFTPIAQVYKDHGYATGYIGKWHVDGVEKPGFVPPGPRRQGFDDWAAFNRGHNYWSSVYFRDDPTPIPMAGYEPNYQTDLAIDYVKMHRERPFCLFMSWGPPHTPFYPQKEEQDERWEGLDPDRVSLRPNVPESDKTKASREIAGYNTHITALDDNIGRLLAALEEEGVADNTIFVFTSDHGDMLGSLGKYRKSLPEEESVHIPFIIRYPDHIQAGSTNDAMFQTVDFMPTLLALSGLSIPEGVQGTDVSRAILQNDAAIGPDAVYLEGKIGQPEQFRMLRTKRHMLAIHVVGLETVHLYDMDSDPYQLNNLVGSAEQAELERSLREQLFQWARKTQDEAVVSQLR
jgi:arylsulfatase A-like enzyme